MQNNKAKISFKTTGHGGYYLELVVVADQETIPAALTVEETRCVKDFRESETRKAVESWIRRLVLNVSFDGNNVSLTSTNKPGVDSSVDMLQDGGKYVPVKD